MGHMRCDLHVHTRHSGMCTVPVMRHICRESYNEPVAVYEKLKRAGMDLVTITDHDSIDAVEQLRSKPDFFLSEEVTCTLPSGTELHMGVYDITERDLPMIMVGTRTVIIGFRVAESDPNFDRYEVVSLVHIVRLEPIPEPQKQAS